MSLTNRNIVIIEDLSSEDFECLGGKLRVKFPASGGGGDKSCMFFDKLDGDNYLKLISSHVQRSNVTPFVVPSNGAITTITLTNKNVDAQGTAKIEVNGSVVYTWNFSTGVTSTTSLITGLNIPVNIGDTIAVFGDNAATGNTADQCILAIYF